ncbi:NAD(P)/FAD-dependent oxidoreductase [Paenibacillus yanchengensis]|uniref:NAD(P)/FAD-dependent oxidoreductase n=1 Tax=Paenibacillus yanchengensis TaxID=2035833 RepID=A0ABW4YR46_9BACL
MYAYDAAIIGAGIAGSALAKSLADSGWNTILFESKKFPRHKVCGEFLSPEAKNMLDSLGVNEHIQSLRPSLIERSRLIFSHGDVLEAPLASHALGLSRYALDDALLTSAQLAGAHVQTGSVVTAVTPCNGGFIVETKQGKETVPYKVRTVIAAWGSNGRMPGTASYCTDSNSRKVKNPYVGVKSHVVGITMDAAVELYFFEGGYLGISPVEDGKFNVSALLRQKAFQDKPKSIQGWLDAACSRNPQLLDKLSNAVPITGTQVAVAPVHISRKPLVWDLYPQVGDAGLMIPPLCGDGMSMALRSALVCAALADRYLSGQITLDHWRHHYEQFINQQLKGPRQWGRLLQWMIDTPALPRMLVPCVRFTPGLMQRLVKATRLKDMPIDFR